MRFVFGCCSMDKRVDVWFRFIIIGIQQIELFISIKCFRVTQFGIMRKKGRRIMCDMSTYTHGFNGLKQTGCMLANRVSSIGFYLSTVYLEYLIVWFLCSSFVFGFCFVWLLNAPGQRKTTMKIGVINLYIIFFRADFNYLHDTRLTWIA